MENIITGILEIEQQAKDKLDRAEFERNKIIADAKMLKDQITSEKISEMEKKLDEIQKTELEKSQNKLAEIEDVRTSEIARLNDAYEKNHEQWQDEIFASVING